MASLALGLALGGVGNFLLPGIGGSLGFSLGAMIGSRLGHKSHQSPQLKDLRVQTSEYGEPIPIGFGTIRMAGRLEWSAPKVAHKHKQGGKGGPKVTTTTYTCSFRIGLLETSFLDGDGVLINNPILGILKVWANGRLVLGEGSGSEALPMAIYYGTEDQMPDPTIESYEGVGQVSADRGKSSVVFTDLELAPFGDAIPNFTFEVVASGSIGLENFAVWPVDYDFPIDASTYAYPEILAGIDRTGANELTMHRYRSGNDYGGGPGNDNIVYYDVSRFDLQGADLGSEPQATIGFDTAHVFIRPSLNSGICYAYWVAGSTQSYAWLKDGVVTFESPGGWLPISAAPVYWNGYVYASGESTALGNMSIHRWPAADGAVYGRADPLFFDADAERTGYPAVLGWSADAGNIAIGTDGFIYWLVGYYSGSGDGTRLFKLDADLNLVATWWTGSGADLPTAGYGITVWNGHIIEYQPAGIYDVGHANFILYRLNGDGTTTWVDEIQPPTLANTPLQYIGGNLSAHRFGILQLGSGVITLGDMVANVSQHVGYAIDEYDVEQLTDVVRGACISQRTSGRAAIEAWQPAYGFGAVESNFANKFVKWGGEVVATIPAADLGAREAGTEAGDPIKRTLVTDKDLPRRVEVIFLNKNMDYQEGMQPFNLPVKSDINVAISMALVLTDAEGLAVAENVGVNALVERNKFTFSLPRKWAHLEPTDVIAIGDDAIRIVNKDEQGYTHILYEGISTRIGEWIVAPFAPEVVYVPQAPPQAVSTDLLLLDTALARDPDAQLGFNSAMAGRTSATWPGAGLYKSIDGGATYELITAAADADEFGVATTAFPDFGGGNIVDESSTLTVRLGPGSGDLSSTNYLGLLNGANLFAIGTTVGGYELAQYRDATLTATTSGGAKTYDLRGFLRGRRGTEWAMGTHAADDNFVALPAHNVDGTSAELGVERLYKAVTSGSTLSSATAVAFTNNGVALKPYAPVLLGGGRNAAGDIIINWQRRSRIGWAFNQNVPLGETTELYNVTVYANGTYTTVKRAGAVTTPTLTYTAALQSTDFGLPQSTIYVGVQQLGSRGYGYQALAII